MKKKNCTGVFNQINAALVIIRAFYIFIRMVDRGGAVLEFGKSSLLFFIILILNYLVILLTHFTFISLKAKAISEGYVILMQIFNSKTQ